MSPLRFGRRPEPPNPYDDLRRRVFEVDPRLLGPVPEGRRVYGATFETGLDAGSFTLVCLADGTTSLYLSNGGGIIGGGEHPRVVTAARAFLDAVEGSLAAFASDRDDAPPAAGLVVFRALGPGGRRRLDGNEDELAGVEHPLLVAGHGVLTELRLLREGRG